MGYYINPTDGRTKEQFLSDHGGRINPAEVKAHNFSGETLPVCLVDNGWMTAAGIAYSRREVEAFSQPDDHRPKQWFVVNRKLLAPFLPEDLR